MLKTISFISISVHHILTSYWPYLNEQYQSSQKLSIHIDNLVQTSETLTNKIKIIYENSMMGLMIGLSFFHLMPLANRQIAAIIYLTDHTSNTYKQFHYGTMTAIFAFVFVLGNSNYFYHTNSTKTTPKRGNFRSRSQFEHQMLTNKKLKIRRRLAIQPLPIQLMISLPSILLTSSLASNNEPQIWFWCLITILFEKHHICSYFGRSYFASVVQKQEAIKFIFYQLSLNIIYLGVCCLIVELYPIVNGILNGISCGIIMYDVMIQRLANNYEQKSQLFEKLLFFVCGVILSSLIISN